MEESQRSKMHIAVLSGGSSNEREISLSSGREVMKALQGMGYTCEMLDPLQPDHMIERLLHGQFDVVFIALHGTGGEDGTIQGLCDLLGLVHTGSGVLASALAMDKARAKICFADNGIPVSPSVHIRKGQQINVDEIIEIVGEKCVVKPNRDGSSVGTHIIHNVGELHAIMETLFEVSDDMIIEKYISGTEVTVVVLGNDEPWALPVIEIVPHAEFYDFVVKYSENGAEHIIPARLSEDIYKRVQEYAVKAHEALGCRGMSRSDFIIQSDGKCVILETNTIPGFTPTSLLPDAARHDGYDFGAICEKIIELALE